VVAWPEKAQIRFSEFSIDPNPQANHPQEYAHCPHKDKTSAKKEPEWK